MSKEDVVTTYTLSMKRVKLLNRYYKITKFYSFLKEIAIKGGIVMLVTIFILVGLELFFLDFSALLNHIVNHFSTWLVLMVFYLSESITGIFPPEIFIAWAAKMPYPWWILFFLATLSYLGGITAYFIGYQLSKTKIIKNYIEIKAAKQIEQLRKWGGLLIVVGATLPPPHALISLASGMIHYNFKHYLMWALFRYLRFLLYAIVIFGIL